MKPARWKLMTALALLALLLSGCINITQEYWVNGDGSAKVSLDVGLSQALMAMGSAAATSTSGNDNGTSAPPSNPLDDLRKTYSGSNPHIKNVQVREYKDSTLQHFAVTFDVNDFEDFLKNQDTSDTQFDITLTHQADGTILFTQLTDLNTGNQSQTQGLDPSSMQSVFKDMYWTVTVHVPQVVSTNGTKLDNGTVQWKIPMADVFSGKAPAQLTVVYKPTGGGVLGGIFGGGSSSNNNGGSSNSSSNSGSTSSNSSSGSAGNTTTSASSSVSGGGSILGLLLLVLVLILVVGAAFYFLVLRRRPARQGAFPGYPPQQPGGFPPTGGYSSGMGPQAGYPPQQPGGYPPQQAGGYPPQQGFPQQPGYPPQQPGSYPPQQGYPPQQPGGVPPQQGYPRQSPGSVPPNPQYPPAQYPPAQYPPVPPAGNPNSYPPQPPQQPPEESGKS